ncbi:MAG: N-acetylneuraminate synthase [Candidatus Saganbacteria bacterium]|uniref:N-acetylneuraminate synthase n=1 Tax=Candidatus Saganbacteria bacterium TaxID=2575572 RepID=A0A833L2F5_UNCSA|nr:MAG: N-acetylneuraminate synthase [Candidatus Saganbacteria bacterium]
MRNFNELIRPYLIAEVGINHNGDLQIAKQLIDATFACSWDCVKFQKRNPDICVPEKQKSVIRKTPWGEMTYLEYKHKLEFGKKEYDYIDQYCREKPLDWSLSVWDVDSLRFAVNYNLPFIKIPSAHLTHHELLKEACNSKLPIILSTGMSDIEEIDKAVEILDEFASQYVLLHCNSSYPARYDELNLRMIPKFKERYNCLVGYSGHEYGLESTAVAASLGVVVVERHITLDHSMWGTDQASSVEVQGMDKLSKTIKVVSQIIGDGQKRIFESEKKAREKLRGFIDV